ARIAFSVASLTDSRTILDTKGAEKLIGRGDMLFQTADLSKPMRLQGAFISEDEVKRITEYLKGSGTPMYEDSVVEKTANKGTMNLFGGTPDDQDPLLEESKQAILDAGKASASFLQRKLKIGYARAARILDELEEAGVIGPANGAKPREILLTEADINHTTDSGGSLNVFTHQPYTSGEKREPLLDAYPQGESEEEKDEEENEIETDNDDAIEEETFDDEETDENEDADAIDDEENTDMSEETDEDEEEEEHDQDPPRSIRSGIL
nr:DNA translocase FtsK [Candidatus Magasanikbacteria bacterium]